jgi:primosomal protein N' (replication factor Y)
MPKLVQVAAFVPVHGTFTYRVPGELAGLVQPGCRVLVPFGTKKVMGVVVPESAASPPPEEAGIKAILDVLDAEPVLGPRLLDLVLWMARYYLAPTGEAIRTALPAPLHARERQLIRITQEGQRVLAAQQAVLRSDDDDLTAREHDILEQLQRARQRVLSLRSLQAGGSTGRALGNLLQRNLVAQVIHRRGEGRFRTDLVLELLEPVDVAPLSRAPRQLALVEALRAAGGRARLGNLPGRPTAARQLARRLAERGILRLETVDVPRDPFAAEPVEVERPPTLTEEQTGVLAPLVEASRARVFSAFLLHGVTSSGKTEVYLRLIAEVLDQGRSAIVLVPEISLTPQLAARFRARFGNQVAVLHSGLTDAERYGQWRLIRAAQVRIVVGARSAIFAPVEQVGVLIVDEEHDPSFKQEEGVRYNARDLALLRAREAGAVAVLGSATPSLESYHGAEQGRLQLLEMHERATPRPLPEVEIVDMRRYQTGPEGFLTAPMAQALADVLQRKEQAILFLNRRGFSTFLLCRLCGHVFRCDNCSVSMTYHHKRQRIICHYCGLARLVPTRCPACEGEAVVKMGLGTEQVEQALLARFPEARIARLDRDTATGRGLRSILGEVGRREVDILVGTQMVTKGHDFPHVTLVGVLGADLGLHFPDFRAAERTFQLLTQVAGRAGRGDRPGRVVIQTYSPEHPSILHSRTHDFVAFYREESESRRELGYPPWGHLAAIRVDGRDGRAVEQTAQRIAVVGRQALTPRTPVSILGPAEAPLQRLKGKTRWMLLLKSPQRGPLRDLLEVMLAGQTPGRVRVTADVDPRMML